MTVRRYLNTVVIPLEDHLILQRECQTTLLYWMLMKKIDRFSLQRKFVTIASRFCYHVIVKSRKTVILFKINHT